MCNRNVMTALVALLVMTGGLRGQSTLHVPGQYPAIQGAIYAALPGDEIVVAAGTYFETIDFLGKDITIRSSSGRGVTFIDGGLSGTVVRFENGETSAAVLRGFTVTNGLASGRGGGMRCIGASPTIDNVLFHDNQSAPGDPDEPSGPGNGADGGGVYMENSSAYFIECHFTFNQAGDGADAGPSAPPNSRGGNGGRGGAIFLSGGSPDFIDCAFDDNRAGDGGSSFLLSPGDDGGDGGHGGALFMTDGVDVHIFGTFLRRNRSGHGGYSEEAIAGHAGSGGVIFMRNGSTLDVAQSHFLGNGTGHGGDTPPVWFSPLWTIGGNGGDGAAIFATDSTVSITDAEIAGNTCGAGGLGTEGGRGGSSGALHTQQSSVYIANVQITNNAGGTGGAGGLPGDGGNGAITLGNSTAEFYFCPIIGSAGGTGGELGLWMGSDPGTGGAGAIFADGSTLELRLCLLHSNTGGPGGNDSSGTSIADGGRGGVGGLHSHDSDPTIRYATIAGNEAGYGGAGMTNPTPPPADLVATGTGILAMTNTVAWPGVGFDPTITGNLTYTCIPGGWPGVGNVAGDPRFVDPDHDDFKLGTCSPCLDAGLEGLPDQPSMDMGWGSRVSGITIDIGAFESAPDTTLQGTCDDLWLETWVDGIGPPGATSRIASPGDQVDITLRSPAGTFDGAVVLLLAQLYSTGFPPDPFPGYPSLLINPTGGPILPIYVGGLTTPGVSFSFTTPAGFSGETVRLQGIAPSPLALNAIFAATNGHDITIP